MDDAMTGNGATFLESLDERVSQILDACTRCGRCVEVCPMVEPAGLDRARAEAIVGGVLDILRTGEGPADAERWATVCSGSGFCIPACDYGVNPRFMLAMARRALTRAKGDAEAARRDGVQSFKGMSRGVRVLSRLQLPPDLLRRVSRSAEAEEGEAPDLVFYTGCNVLKTPHIVLLCLDVLDLLGVRYRVHGGPSDCCGILQTRAGDTANAGRQGYRSIERFAESKSGQVLSWCPTCQIQMGETMMPSYAGSAGRAPFEMPMFVVWLADRLDDLRPLFVNRVEKRVGLHEHPGVSGVGEAARRILEAIPGLEFVDLEQPRVGYMCNSLSALPDYKRSLHEQQFEAAAAAGVTTLAGVYHACHRELCSHERDWPFEVVNFMELVGESLGIQRPDLFKRLKVMQDVDAIIADSRDLIEAYDLDLEEVRTVVLKDVLGEQPLPLRGA